jgi:hypothetical protein
MRAGHLECTSKLTNLQTLSVTACARTDTTPILNVVRNCRRLSSVRARFLVPSSPLCLSRFGVALAFAFLNARESLAQGLRLKAFGVWGRWRYATWARSLTRASNVSSRPSPS